MRFHSSFLHWQCCELGNVCHKPVSTWCPWVRQFLMILRRHQGPEPLCRFFKRSFILPDGQRLPLWGRSKSEGGHRYLRKQKESWTRKMMCKDRGQGWRMNMDTALSHTMASTDCQGKELQSKDEWGTVTRESSHEGLSFSVSYGNTFLMFCGYLGGDRDKVSLCSPREFTSSPRWPWNHNNPP